MASEQSNREDFQLATRIKDERCEASFNRLFEKHKGLVHWKCYQQLFNHEDAEDATQEVFASLWERKIDSWNGGIGSIAGFLCGIARNVARNMWRFERTPCRYSENMLYLDEVIDEDGNTPQIADPRTEYLTSREDEVEAEIDRVLLKLPASEAACRLAWTLMYREGYDRKETAQIMGITWQKVSVLVKRAEMLIKATLQEFYQRLIANDADWLENRTQFRSLFDE